LKTNQALKAKRPLKIHFYFLLITTSVFSACSFNGKVKEGQETKGSSEIDASGSSSKSNDLSAISTSLTFHASFDEGADADFALGDPRIYSGKTVRGQQKPVSSEPGLGNPALAIAPGQGKFGAALEFTQENSHVVFYKAEKNVAFSPENFSGSLSFWLRLDPQKIPQTYIDPIQLTDKDFLEFPRLHRGSVKRIADQ
jgi:hypothetical protein